MASGPRFVLPYQTVIDATGAPIPGALLFFYLSGSSTPANTYSDSGLTTPNANPVVASAGGQFPNIFLDPSVSYKAVLENALGNLIWTADPLGETGGGNLATIVVSASTNLQVGNSYGFLTGVGAFNGYLPSLASVSVGATIEVLDVGNNAAANPITVVGNGGDSILYWGSSANSLALDVNGAGVRLIAEAAGWRAIPIAGT